MSVADRNTGTWIERRWSARSLACRKLSLPAQPECPQLTEARKHRRLSFEQRVYRLCRPGLREVKSREVGSHSWRTFSLSLPVVNQKLSVLTRPLPGPVG